MAVFDRLFDAIVPLPCNKTLYQAIFYQYEYENDWHVITESYRRLVEKSSTIVTTFSKVMSYLISFFYTNMTAYRSQITK